jgi:flagellar motor switch protein FliN/FliY
MHDNMENNDFSNDPTNPSENIVKQMDNQQMDLVMNLNMTLSIEVGRTIIKLRDLLNLDKGSVVELDKLATEPLNIYANGKLIAFGTIITVNGRYCVRLVSTPKTDQETSGNPSTIKKAYD